MVAPYPWNCLLMLYGRSLAETRRPAWGMSVVPTFSREGKGRRNKRATACDYHHIHRRDLPRTSYGPNPANPSLRVAPPYRADLFRYSRDRTRGTAGLITMEADWRTEEAHGRRGTPAKTVAGSWVEEEAEEEPLAAIFRLPP